MNYIERNIQKSKIIRYRVNIIKYFKKSLEGFDDCNKNLLSKGLFKSFSG